MKSSYTSHNFNPLLDDFRQSIDNIDNSFIFIIAERVRIIMKSICFKQQQHLPIRYSERRKQDLQKTIDIAVEHHLNEKFIRKLFDYIYHQAMLTNEQKNISTAYENRTYGNSDDKTNKNTIVNKDVGVIQDFQDSIYHLDVALCCLLAERYHLVKKIGILKKKYELPPLAANRWQKILSNKLTMAAALNLDVNFMKNIMEIIHEESLRIENEIITKKS